MEQILTNGGFWFILIIIVVGILGLYKAYKRGIILSERHFNDEEEYIKIAESFEKDSCVKFLDWYIKENIKNPKSLLTTKQWYDLYKSEEDWNV